MRPGDWLTHEAVDIEGLGFLRLSVQKTSADVGAVLQGSGEAFPRVVGPWQRGVAGSLVEGDVYLGVGNGAGDGALPACLHHHLVPALNEPDVLV